MSLYIYVFIWLFLPKLYLEDLKLAFRECHKLESSVRLTEKEMERNTLGCCLHGAGLGLGHRAEMDTWPLCLGTCDACALEPKLGALELARLCAGGCTLRLQRESPGPKAELEASSPPCCLPPSVTGCA